MERSENTGLFHRKLMSHSRLNCVFIYDQTNFDPVYFGTVPQCLVLSLRFNQGSLEPFYV